MEKWSCLRSGHCCSVVGHVTMTDEEADLLKAKAVELGLDLVWTGHEEAGFTRLVGNPACPFLTTDALNQPACQVHEVRPYNCRRWGCFRVGTDQPFDVASVNRRIEHDRTIRRQAKLLQRRAQKWAVEHGWEHNRDSARKP